MRKLDELIASNRDAFDSVGIAHFFDPLCLSPPTPEQLEMLRKVIPRTRQVLRETKDRHLATDTGYDVMVQLALALTCRGKARNRYAEAHDAASRAISLSPSKTWAFRLRGQIGFLRGLRNKARMIQAREDFTHALTLDMGEVVSLYGRALCWEVPALRQLETAQTLRERGRAKAHSLIVFAERGLTLALEDYSRLLELQPRNALALFHRGTCLSQLGNLEGALDDLDTVEASGLQSFHCDSRGAAICIASSLVERSHVHAALGKGSQAIFDIKRAAAIFAREGAQREESSAYKALVRLAFQRGEHHEVVEAVSSLEKRDRDSMLLLQRGRAFFELGSYELARADASRVLSEDPDDFDARFLRGCCAAKLSIFQTAAADFDRCIELRPGDKNCLAWRAWVNAQAGNFNCALGDAWRVLAQDGHPHPLALLAMGLAHHSFEAHQEARRALELACSAGAEGAEELLERWYSGKT